MTPIKKKMAKNQLSKFGFVQRTQRYPWDIDRMNYILMKRDRMKTWSALEKIIKKESWMNNINS